MRVLSLDIGSYSIKAVELDVSFGRVELGSYVVERVVEPSAVKAEAAPPAAEGQSAQAQQPPAPQRQILTQGQLAAIRKVLTEHPFRFDKLAVNIPKSWITTRIFHFPTKDRKTVQNSLNFELDDDIPFPMGDVIFDFAILGSEGGSSTVFTAVALKADLTALLSELQMMGLDPDSVTIEPWAMSQLLRRSPPKEIEGRPVCIVNIGNSYTGIHMHVGDGPVMSHVSTCAGSDVTRAIAQSYGLGYDEAERAKVDGSFLLTEAHLREEAGGEKITDDQRRFSATISDALAPMIREIKQTLMSYKSHYKLSPRAVFVTGGTSLIPNMPLFLEEQLKLPVYPLTYMSRIVGQTLQLSEASEAQIAAATGLALSLSKVDRSYNINFRKEIFAKRGGLGAMSLKAYKRPLKFVAASLAFVYVNLIAQGIILSSRSGKQDAQLERAIKSVVGAVNPSVMSTYKSSPSTLKSAVSKELAKYKDTQAPPPKLQVSAFDVLNRVSAAIPKDMTLDVSTFEVKDGKFKLAGVVDQAANAGRVGKALEDVKLLSAVSKEKVEEDPKSKKTKFEFSGKVGEATDVKTR